jgi:stage IV sporulation protein FB
MMIGEPMPSQYDWRFSFFGIPIRVTWLFWLINAALGYSSAMSVDNMYQKLSRLIPEVSSPGLPSLLVVWVTAAFVSVLIHELGHSLAFRYYGIESQIVLYHMGGLAIPTAGYLFRRAGTRQRLTHLNQIVISAAGPGLQFLTAVIVAGIAIYNGIDVPMVSTLAEWSGLSWNSAREATLDSVPRSAWVYAMVEFYVLISVWWPLFNLLPVYPLDGGHIAQHTAAIVRRTDGQYEAHLIGAIVGVAVAWWLYTRGSPINALLFLSLAMSNFQALQQRSGPPNW